MSKQRPVEVMQTKTQVLSSPFGSVRALLRKTAIGATALLLSLSGVMLTGVGPAGASDTSPPDTVTDLSAYQTDLTGTVTVHFTPPSLNGEELAAYIVAADGPNGEHMGYYADEFGNATFMGLTSGTWSFKEITVASPTWSEISNVVEVNVVTAPGAPTEVLAYSTAEADWVPIGSVYVGFTPSTDTGGVTTLYYLVEAHDLTDASASPHGCIAGPGYSSNWFSCFVDGLKSHLYNFTVKAVYAIPGTTDVGSSSPGTSENVTAVGATPLTPSMPSITNLPNSGSYGDSFTPTVSTDGDGNTSVSSSTTDICTVTNGVVNFIGVGTCTLVAHVAEGATYSAADGGDQSFTVNRASSSAPSITNFPGSGTFNGSFTPVVSSTGDGSTSVTSSITSVCTVTSGTVNYIGAGTCTLVAHVAQGATYSAADGGDQSFTVASVRPSAPGTPVLTDNHGSFSVTWSQPVTLGGAQVTYSVYVATNGGVFTQTATGLTATLFTYQGTSAYNTYAFRVRATNTAGSSALSAYSWLQARNA